MILIQEDHPIATRPRVSEASPIGENGDLFEVRFVQNHPSRPLNYPRECLCRICACISVDWMSMKPRAFLGSYSLESVSKDTNASL